MKPVPIIVAIGFALAMFLPQPVQGQDILPGLTLAKVDTDGDRRISKDEYVANRDKQFARFDRDNDGSLSQTDFPGKAPYWRSLGKLEDRIKDADTNGDGLLSRAEVHNAPTVLFDRADYSRNGYVSEREIAMITTEYIGIR